MNLEPPLVIDVHTHAWKSALAVGQAPSDRAGNSFASVPRNARAACLLSVMLAAACATDVPQNPAPMKVVRVAHVAPMTGGLAHLGRDNANGARLALDEANQAGLRLDGAVVRFELVLEDDQADPRMATQVAQKVVAGNVAGVIGHLNSGVSIPASAIYRQAGLPMITPSSSNPRLTDRGLDNVFRLIARDDAQGKAIAAYLLRNQERGPVAVLDDGTAYGELVADSVQEELNTARVAVMQRQIANARSLDPVVERLRIYQPPVVFYGGMDTGAGPLLRRARQEGVRSTFYFSDGACTDQMSDLAGTAAEGFLCAQGGVPPQAVPRRFLDAYRRSYGQAPILYAPFTYDAVNVLIGAMTRAGSADPRKYLPELRRTSQVGMTGPIAFDERGDRRDAAHTIFMMAGGRLRPVAIISGNSVTPYERYLELNASR